jgi:hypothetical protein
MFEQVTTKPRSRWQIFWPDVSDLVGAEEAIRLGYGACFVLAALQAIVATFGPKAGLVDAVLFAVLGVWLRRKSRVAAVIALGLMCLNVLVSLQGAPVIGVITVILLACLASSVRGTFAYRQLRSATPEKATV